jgi:hypothetical protein
MWQPPNKANIQQLCKIESLQHEFAMHWCFNYISRMPSWVRLKFGQQVNFVIMLFYKKIQKNPHHHFGFMIKSLKEETTGNEFAALLFVRSQRQFQNGSCTSRKLLEKLVT